MSTAPADTTTTEESVEMIGLAPDGTREKIVLAYSGGLDTSICIKWLQMRGFDVIALCGDVGQEHDGLEKIKSKALASGAIECMVVDMRQDFADDMLTKALKANSLYENKYPLLSALSRPIIAKHLVNAAHKFGAKYIAHGCTAKGNDQVRIETSVITLDPSLKIIAPVRMWDFKTRPQEMDWAEAHGIEVPTTKDKPFSIDDNLWGRAIECGVLENPWNAPIDGIWSMTVDPEDAPDEPTIVEIEFREGIPTAIDGKPVSYLEAIYAMNEVAGKNGYGRLDLIENRLVGVKSRECYECPGSLTLINAHKALEALVLERDVLHYKLGIEQTWATLVYDGQWFAPLKIALDAFIAETQKCVTGTVRLKFYKGSCTVNGLKSPFSLYDEGLATYDEGDTFDHDAAKGFIELYSLPAKVWSENRHAMHALGQDFENVTDTTDEFSK